MKKGDNHKMMDPRMGNIAQQNAVMPGGPQGNPYPVIQANGQGVQTNSLYGDYPQNYPQMGTGMLNPEGVGHSGLQQNFPVMRGKNAQAPYGMQQQPDTRAQSPMTDMMESSRLNMGIQQGLPTGMMGYTGMPAIPGGMPGNMPGTSGNMLPTLDSMARGGSLTKTGQKKKGGKK